MGLINAYWAKLYIVQRFQCKEHVCSWLRSGVGDVSGNEFRSLGS